MWPLKIICLGQGGWTTVIISASRRTDIPAFYSQWFINRIREGYCTVFNPFNRHQISRVSLLPSDVEVIVFWTKNARPLLDHLNEIDERGFKYYFQYTVNGYPSQLEPYIPELDIAIETFATLATRLGPDKLIWRYDPILISNITGYDYHIKHFEKIATLLRGKTQRVAISIVDEYRKAVNNFKDLKKQDIFVSNEFNNLELSALMRSLADVARQNGMTIYSCAETLDLRSDGIMPGKCIDDQYIRRVFGQDVVGVKDKSQRLECGCTQSKDIGVYDTCLHGCAYCYAGTLQSGRKNSEQHYADSPSLMGRYDVLAVEDSDKIPSYKQSSLFEEGTTE